MPDMVIAVLTHALYLLVMINPVSKISILSVFATDDEKAEFVKVVTRSTIIALVILLMAMVSGNFVLRSIFHIDLFSLKIAGGSVLIWVGFKALSKGVFFEVGTQHRFADISIVPLACPMIAGPGTIAAVLTLGSNPGLSVGVPAIFIAIACNMVLMFSARQIGGLLRKYNILGALIRITGLIVMAMGVQMVADGITMWQGR